MDFAEIVSRIGSDQDTWSELNPPISGVAQIEDAQPGQLSYIEGAGRYATEVDRTQASALILPADPELQATAAARNIAWISTKHPRLTFAQAIALFFQPYRPAPGIHPTAVIPDSITLGKNVSIGAHVAIADGVELGDEVCLLPNVVVYPGVKIGDRTIIHANCTIEERTQIGADCIIHSGSVIGSDGFGFVPTATGWYKMQQSGYVILEDGVEVGSNSTIDRPAVGTTRLDREAKLDNMVHIGHGCQVGKAGAMAAQVALAGGVTIGDRCLIGGQVGIANRVKIGDGVNIMAKSGVHSNVAAGETVAGYPAIPNKLFARISVLQRKLPEIFQAFKKLSK